MHIVSPIRRVILPGDMSIAEAAAMARAAPEIEFEVFVLNDACVFEDGVWFLVAVKNELA